MKLNTPLVGVGIGGAASAVTQVALRMEKVNAKIRGDGTSTIRKAIADNPGAAGLVAGGAAAGVLFATKRKQAALGAALGAAAASLPGIVADFQARAALPAATTPPAAVPPAGFLPGPVRNRGYGAPVIELFGASPALEVTAFGAPQSANLTANLAAFGARGM